ncbi:MAG: hypothetical protein P8N94_06855 [Gammaproteobacteria bacterium]|nr:hypothetical protein [Gammaproteobacteria bacterium]
MIETLEKSLHGAGSTPVNIVVAHALEAKALIPMLHLQPFDTTSRFVQYGNSNNLHLIVSGIGRAAMEAAITDLSQQQANEEGQIRAWLNIGIAGHSQAPLGGAWLGNKITCQVSGVSAYPPQLIAHIDSGAVITVDEPERTYPEDAAYEMEAFSFFEQATKYSTAELVQVFKIISDNLENPIEKLDFKNVPNWIGLQQEQIILLISKMSSLVGEYNDSNRIPEVYRDLCSRMHLTVNQKLQLRRLCLRYKALGLESDLESVISLAGSHSKKVISQLSAQIDRVGKQ